MNGHKKDAAGHGAQPAAGGERRPGERPMQLRHPRSFADVEEIIDRLREKQSVIVYLNEVSGGTAQRVTDMLSGAIYALGGGMAPLQKDMYIFTPNGVETKKFTKKGLRC